ncbi:MAG: VCBS repeat-containing protein [Candidatus Helarchaeota archaeon]|nr:VCBS repeat-containing protein [Candidatus Helarchaeota archaeon]
MTEQMKSKFGPFQNSIYLIFFVLDLVTVILIIIGLIDLALELDLVKYICFSLSALAVLIGGASYLFWVYRKNELKLSSFRKAKAISFLLIPAIIIVFAIVTIVGRHYALTVVMGIILLGFLAGYTVTPRLNIKYRRLSRIIYGLVIFAIIAPSGFLIRGTLDPRAASQVWAMHELDNPGFLLSNGLDPADVNKDGFEDYVTNYEWDGTLRVEFHPGLAQVKEHWPAITIGQISNAESSGFGDFDGDGNFDVVVAHGSEIFGSVTFPIHAGVLFIWGPPSENCMEAGAWEMSKDIDGTIDGGQYLYVRGRDVNGDGALDVVVGGRGLNPRAGLKWIEAPFNLLDRRNASQWQVHNIDATLKSGHGFAFADIDQDGDFDIALCNSDWDTPEEEEEVMWYENPGTGTPEQRNSWPKHLLYRSTEFFAKGQVTLFNLTGDSYPEILIQSDNEVLIFKNPLNPQVNDTWEIIRILKVPEACWYSRPIKVGDINNDTKPDILGMLVYRNGALPPNKAAVFWMEYSGTDPLSPSANWTTHVIKWGEGFLGFISNGEKWDQCKFEDVDRDGDLDIVANCEELHTLGFVYISVVWFENPLV